MTNLNDLTFDQLQKAIEEAGEPKFRAKQIFLWFALGVTDYNLMTNISKSTKEKLSSLYSIATVKIYKKFKSSIDETVKYLLELNDGNIVESVAMKYKHGITLCLSTQCGCNMGCRFCASTIGGKDRDLTSGEILGQAALIQADLGERISNIVLMGIGEPLDNYNNIITFLKNVNDENGMNIGYRHISLSTCGLVDKINMLAKEKMPITLSVSLHAPDDETRNKIMPVNKKYSVDSLIDCCKDYIESTGRRISFEYILIDGLNDTYEHAKRLSSITKNMLCHINLIPANFVPESGLKKSSKENVIRFLNALQSFGVNATVRRTLGSDIEASCGQLRRNEMNK
ncbi:MAG: 23S rRNA (adenine(2503)-C(2))-methyltransferase RlmN [Clostridia bacterium]|nr:23S rRNA (adenine(2503)-C(2))-methyltransferase RlmN [Clostridia bacterium]